ncbi:amidohydrolase family protein [Streptomyces sp. NPDC091272]|uniref:amidohydrolase family protein n=1 Tax=Streptomyces sp. NPDC091272 TaxID=3365981 RepID=UPI0038126F2D
MTSVDVHAHYFPEQYLDVLDEVGGSPVRTAGLRGGGGGSTPAEIDARIAAMDAAGTDVQVVSATPLTPYFDDTSQALGAARVANAAFADLVRAHPTRFRALAALPLPNGLAAGDELGHCMDELGFLGAAITTTVLGRSLGDPEFVPLLDALERRGAVLLLHPTGGENVQQSYDEMDLSAYPGIRPITTGRTPPDRPLSPLHHHAVTDADALRRAAVTYGPERLLRGSGYPYRAEEGFDAHVPEENATVLLGL